MGIKIINLKTLEVEIEYNKNLVSYYDDIYISKNNNAILFELFEYNGNGTDIFCHVDISNMILTEINDVSNIKKDFISMYDYVDGREILNEHRDAFDDYDEMCKILLKNFNNMQQNL